MDSYGHGPRSSSSAVHSFAVFTDSTIPSQFTHPSDMKEILFL